MADTTEPPENIRQQSTEKVCSREGFANKSSTQNTPRNYTEYAEKVGRGIVPAMVEQEGRVPRSACGLLNESRDKNNLAMRAWGEHVHMRFRRIFQGQFFAHDRP